MLFKGPWLMKKLYSLLFFIFFVTACHLNNQENFLIGHWIEKMPVNKQIIQGINLNADGSASSIGMETLKYKKWKLKDKQLILYGESIGNRQIIDFTDTFDILEVTPYTLKVGKFGQYRVDYYRVDKNPDIQDMDNLPNLLQKFEGCGSLQTRVFEGTLPAASNPGIVYNITLYNYKNSADGIFKAKLTYLEAQKGKNISFEFSGRQYTLRGNDEDKNAVIWQFVPFNKKEETMNFLYQNQNLIMLDKNLKKIQSTLNYTLTEIE